jgi:hypothetical protein
MDGTSLILPDNMVRLFGPEDLSSKIDTIVEIVVRSTDTRREKGRRWPSSQPSRRSFFEAPTRPTDLVRFFEAETEHSVSPEVEKLSRRRRVTRNPPAHRPVPINTPIKGTFTPTVLRPYPGEKKR